jgi:hypothetical protein
MLIKNMIQPRTLTDTHEQKIVLFDGFMFSVFGERPWQNERRK